MQGMPSRLRRRGRLAAAAVLAIVGSLAASAAASAAPALTVSTANGAGGTVVVSGTGFASSYTPAPGTGAPFPTTGFYIAQGVVSGGTVTLGTASKWISVGNTATSSRDALTADGSGTYKFSTTLPATTTLDGGAVDCKTTTCVVLAWPAQSNPAATGLIATANLAFGPSLTSTPASVTSGDAVTVTGTDFAQSYTPAPGTGAPFPSAGFYIAQGAYVNGEFKLGANKWLNPANVTPTATQDKLNSDGSFSTTLTTGQTLDSGATDCATYECFVVAWPAQSNPTAANLIVIGSPLTVNAVSGGGSGAGGGGGGGGTPAISVSPTSGLSISGPTTVSVSGSGFDPVKNEGFGIYVMYGPVSATQQSQFLSTATKWVAVGNTPSATRDAMTTSGTFSTTLDVAPTYTDGNGTVVNCTVVQCAVRTMAAHQYSATDRTQDTTALISFGGVVEEQAPAATPSLVPDTPATPAAPTTAANTTAVPSVGKAYVRNGKASLKVSEASTVTFVLRKKVGKRWVTVKTVKVKTTKAGTVSAKLPLSKAGTYRVSIKAVSTKSGKASKTVTKTTTVKAKKATTKQAAKKG